MLAIIEKEYACCEHEKPHNLAYKHFVENWQERTVSIKEFNKKFGATEGLWKSKGKNHKDIKCTHDGCHCRGVHCVRQIEDEEKWVINIENMKEFIKECGHAEMYVSEENGGMIKIII